MQQHPEEVHRMQTAAGVQIGGDEEQMEVGCLQCICKPPPFLKCKILTFVCFVSIIRNQIAVSYQSLELLQEHGIAATDIAKLQAAGYHTVESVRHHSILYRISYVLLIGSV